MKKLIALALGLMLVAGMLSVTAVAEDKPLVTFLINCTTSQYSGSYFKSFNETVPSYPDVEWKVYDGQENATLQAQQMDEAIAEGADLIMLWPQDSKALVSAAVSSMLNA